MAVFKIDIRQPTMDRGSPCNRLSTFFADAEQTDKIVDGLAGLPDVRVEVFPAPLMLASMVITDIKDKMMTYEADVAKEAEKHREKQRVWAEQVEAMTPSETKTVHHGGAELVVTFYRQPDQPGYVRNSFDGLKVEGEGRVYYGWGRKSDDEIVNVFKREAVPAVAA